MDSREMYSAAQHLGSKIKWDEEWIYIGTEEETRIDFLEKLINEYLIGTEVLLIRERTTSGKIQKADTIETIKPILGKDNFELWTALMDKTIVFNKIGVIHLGERKQQE